MGPFRGEASIHTKSLFLSGLGFPAVIFIVHIIGCQFILSTPPVAVGVIHTVVIAVWWALVQRATLKVSLFRWPTKATSVLILPVVSSAVFPRETVIGGLVVDIVVAIVPSRRRHGITRELVGAD